MKNIIIIGCGFAGLSAAMKLRRISGGFKVIVIDEKETFDFLPLLPDCLGRKINPDYLSYPIENLSRQSGFQFMRLKVTGVDLEKKEVIAGACRISYEYLVIASGSQTNFYGNSNIEDNSFKMDNAADAKRLSILPGQGRYQNYVVAGGGYTGVEVSTNLRIALNKQKKNGRVVLVERSPSILGPLPEWMKDYVSANLNRLGVEVLTNSVVNEVNSLRVKLSGGLNLESCALVWVAGVRTSDFIQHLSVNKNPQGRINVDEYLRINNSCFVCGDAAYFPHNNSYLRMAVQFAITQGVCCAENIIKTVKCRKLKAYQPRDLGYIIPMANNYSCGSVLGMNLKGRLPTVFHFIMCIYRSLGLKNKAGIISSLMKRG